MNVRLNNFLIIEFVLLFNHPGYCFCIQHDDELIRKDRLLFQFTLIVLQSSVNGNFHEAWLCSTVQSNAHNSNSILVSR